MVRRREEDEMKEFLRTVLAVLVAMGIIIMFVALIGYSKSMEKAKVEDGSYLVLSARGEIVDYPIGGISEQIFGGGPGSHMDLLENLEKAAVDDRIKGVIMKVDGSTLGYAKIQELRDRIQDVQDAGKKVYCWSEYLSNRMYYLASACDEIYMPPSGYFVMSGVAMGRPHVKNTLDKLGIKPNLHRIEDYKSAAELVLRENMSDEAREMTTWLMNDIGAEYMTAIASDRGMTVSDIEATRDKVLFQPDEALEAGLIDELLFWDELESKLKEEDDKKLQIVSGGTYADVERGELGLKGEKIAIVHAQGMIHSGKSGTDPMMGMTMGAISVIKDLRAVLDDEDIVGVIFRVDSGGGSALASDAIGRWLKQVEKEKPVVVCMADVAASGGYMVSHRIRPIVVSGNTITGSIGSITGKFNMRGFYDKIGMTFDFVTKGPHALINSDYYDWTEEEAEMVAENHWRGFNDWVEDIAMHRDMTFEEVDSVARGRVWTGRQALENNLIDKLGGYDAAIDIIKEKAEIAAEDEITFVHYPVKKSFVEALMAGELATAIKESLVFQVRSYLLKWSMESKHGWYVMPYVIE
jgi:protease-4